MSEPEEPSNDINEQNHTQQNDGATFFTQRHKNLNKTSTTNDFSLNQGQRNQEINRILVENEAMLKRLQNRTSNYNVSSWQKERKSHIKRVKQICMYPPSISTSKRATYRKKKNALSTKNLYLLDMEKRYASAGPNKQMFEMYNLSMRNLQDEPTNLGTVQGHAYNGQVDEAYMDDQNDQNLDQQQLSNYQQELSNQQQQQNDLNNQNETDQAHPPEDNQQDQQKNKDD